MSQIAIGGNFNFHMLPNNALNANKLINKIFGNMRFLVTSARIKYTMTKDKKINI